MTRATAHRDTHYARFLAQSAARLEEAVIRFRDTGGRTGDALRYTLDGVTRRIEALEAEIAAHPDQTDMPPTRHDRLAYWQQVRREQQAGDY